LRISPAIIEAFEIGDFYHMPLKGHARNMVSSYARYLDLNPEEVTKQFLSEYHDFENREARQSSRSFDFDTVDSRHFEAKVIPSSSAGRSADGQGVRSMWNQPIPSSELNRGYDSRSLSAQRMANAASRRRAQSGLERKNRGSSAGYSSSRSLPLRLVGSIFKSPLVLVIVLIIVLVALLVFWAMAANSCKKQEGDIVPMKEATLVDDSGTSAATSGGTPETTETPLVPEQSEENDARYGPFELVVAPVEGTAPWTEVTVDGESVFTQVLSEEQTWEVSESCLVVTAQPDNIQVSRNGEQITVELDANNFGRVELEVEQKPESQGAQGAQGQDGQDGQDGQETQSGQQGQQNQEGSNNG
jgi:hypothetical protein